VNIIAAFEDPRVFGGLPAFQDLATWAPWMTLLRALYGLPMDEQDLTRFRHHTGRTTPAPGGYGELVVITGRQAGKSQIASAIACYVAATSKARSGGHILLLAQDQRAAMRVLMTYVREIFADVPALASELIGSTQDTLTLRNGTSLSVYPCRPASLRGIRSPLVILDELAHMLSTEGNPVDREMLRAARPTLATTGGKLLVLSSPYSASGALYDLHKRHFGDETSSTLVWAATAPEMNSTLSADYLERMRTEDPDAARSEIDGEFRAGVSSLFDTEVIDACVDRNVRERPRLNDVIYSCFIDASSGRADAFAQAFSHNEGRHRVVLDALYVWSAPFDPASVIAEASTNAKRFGLFSVTGDKYAPGFLVSGFREHGIAYRFSERDRSQIYLEALPLLNAGQVSLLDDPNLHRELRALERRRGTAGRDKVDHPRGGHDDAANAACGSLVLAVEPTRSGFRTFYWPGGEPENGWWGTLQYKDGQPWAGICPPDKDRYGNDINRPAVYESGRIIKYL